MESTGITAKMGHLDDITLPMTVCAIGYFVYYFHFNLMLVESALIVSSLSYPY